VEIFDRILAGAHPQVVISTVDFDARLEGNRGPHRGTAVEKEGKPGPPTAAYDRPQLSTPYVEPSTEMEKKIAGVFQKFTRIKEIGANDNFFELGANSLMMVQLNNQLEKAVEKEVSIVTIYAHPTIKALGEFLSKENPQSGISEEEARHIEEKIEKGKSKLEQRKQRSKGIK
jgi:acyl carrier protein